MRSRSATAPPDLLVGTAQDLLGDDVVVAGGSVAEWAGPLLPEESQDVSRAAPIRRQEFAAGRTAARRAMADLGLPPVPLRRHAKGPAIWPDGLTGSISHGGGFVLAALGRTSPSLSALGIDLEPHAPMSPDLAQEVCRPDEDASEAIRIFSAKEAAYKAQFPLTGTLIDFSAMHVTLDSQQGFRAVFTCRVAGFAPGDCLMGCQALVGPLLLSVVRINGNDARR